MKKTLFIIIAFLMVLKISGQTPRGEEMMGLNSVPTADLINIDSPIIGSLLYNPTDEKVYVFTTTGWTTINNANDTDTDTTNELITAQSFDETTDLLTLTEGGVNTDIDLEHLGDTWDRQGSTESADTDNTNIYKDGTVGVGDFSVDTTDANLHIKNNNTVPLMIEPNTSTPTGTSGGQMFVSSDNGILYIYDGTRVKWLSVDRTMIGWGFNNATTTNRYLRQFNGSDSSQNGWRMIRDGTITAITAQTNIAQTWTLEIRKNDETTVIASLTITNAEGNHATNINVDVSAGDSIQAYCNGTSVDFPETLIEIAWRK